MRTASEAIRKAASMHFVLGHHTTPIATDAEGISEELATEIAEFLDSLLAQGEGAPEASGGQDAEVIIVDQNEDSRLDAVLAHLLLDLRAGPVHQDDAHLEAHEDVDVVRELLELAAALPPHMEETFTFFGFDKPKPPPCRRLR